MAARNLCFCILMAMLATNLILAEEEKASFGGFPFSFANLPSLFGLREDKVTEHPESRAAAAEQSSDQEHEDRLFFSSRLIGCNYTAQAGSTCVGCRQALRCLSSNVGLLRYCRGFLPYCNSGRCSFIPGSACNTTSG